MITDQRLSEMARALTDVPGVRAVVLGGSRARGTHHAGSDVDLGVYYDRGELDVAALAQAAARFTEGAAELAGPGEWGPWVDGGGWLSVDGTAVDWILREVGRVREQCAAHLSCPRAGSDGARRCERCASASGWCRLVRETTCTRRPGRQFLP